MSAPRIVAGNWKMNLGLHASVTLAHEVVSASRGKSRASVWIAPSPTAISAVCAACERGEVHVGGQNVHWEESGAFTGETSTSMLRELGCRFALIGHSERRHIMGETDSLCARRAAGALRGSITPVYCVGETKEEREKGLTHQVLRLQLDALLNEIPHSGLPKVVVAYEPVWAIGTGLVATCDDIADAHRFIVTHLRETTHATPQAILYGGSVTKDSFSEILTVPHVDGGLIGGASLSIEKFAPLIEIAEIG